MRRLALRKMKIQYFSDLHLEFPVNKKYLKANPIKPAGEILLLAGDIIPFVEIEKENDFLNCLSDSFEHTYWIPGNHEYYRSDISERTGAFHERIRSNVSLLNNTAIEHKGFRFLFSTLWSKINPALAFVILKSMPAHLVNFRISFAMRSRAARITFGSSAVAHHSGATLETISFTPSLPASFSRSTKYS